VIENIYIYNTYDFDRYCKLCKLCVRRSLFDRGFYLLVFYSFRLGYSLAGELNASLSESSRCFAILGLLAIRVYFVIATGRRFCIGGLTLMIFIEKVSFKQLLCGGILEMNFVFFYCFSIFPFLIINMILIKVFQTLIWSIWSWYFSCLQSIPIDGVEPRMIFYFFVSVYT
jgi:hypothetical protein